MKYHGWALSTIAVICDSEHLPDWFKVREVVLILRHDPHFQECFDTGKSPNQSLQLSIETVLFAFGWNWFYPIIKRLRGGITNVGQNRFKAVCCRG